jgi:hypothetical protein
MIMKEATASAWRELRASGKGANHNASGTATVRKARMILRAGRTRGAVGTVCSDVPTTEVAFGPIS